MTDAARAPQAWDLQSCERGASCAKAGPRSAPEQEHSLTTVVKQEHAPRPLCTAYHGLQGLGFRVNDTQLLRTPSLLLLAPGGNPPLRLCFSLGYTAITRAGIAHTGV